MTDVYRPKPPQKTQANKIIPKPSRLQESVDVVKEIELPPTTQFSLENSSSSSPIPYVKPVSLIDEIATDLAFDRRHQIFSEAEYWDYCPKWFEEEDETFSDEYQAFLSSDE